MVGNWQGPATFEAVLAEAAKRAEAQENHAQQVKEQRSAELRKLAAEIDIALDRRKQQKDRLLTWDLFRPVIEQMKQDGASDVEIAKELCDRGFSTSRREVYAFTVNNGLRPKGEKVLRPSRLDPFLDLIVQMRENQRSFAQISQALNNKGVSITPCGVSDYVKSRHL